MARSLRLSVGVLTTCINAADVLAFNDVVAALVDYSLAKRTQTGLQLHRLVQGVIRARHPQIPPVVLVIGSGTEGKQARYGHHAPQRWHVSGEDRAEIMISGEGLRRGAPAVLGTLLHEAAHALAAVRGIQDTSRQGRYHNKHFKTHAEELGITAGHDQRLGWSVTTLPGDTALSYATQISGLQAALTLWRHDESSPAGTTRRSTNLIAAVCPCGRSIRIAVSTLAEAPVTCGACDGDFTAKDAA